MSAYARHLAWGQPLPKPVTRKMFLEHERNILPLLARLDEIENVRVIYPHERFCDGDVCKYMKGDEVMYFDDNHINAVGAVQLNDMYAEVFKESGTRDIATGSTKRLTAN